MAPCWLGDHRYSWFLLLVDEQRWGKPNPFTTTILLINCILVIPVVAPKRTPITYWSSVIYYSPGFFWFCFEKGCLIVIELYRLYRWCDKYAWNPCIYWFCFWPWFPVKCVPFLWSSWLSTRKLPLLAQNKKPDSNMFKTSFPQLLKL